MAGTRHRGRLICAKLLVLAGYGFIIGVIVVGVCSAIAVRTSILRDVS